MNPGPNSQRIRFANQLRGVAALCVALSHLLGVYWLIPGVVSAATFTPPQQGAPPSAITLISYPWFNFGPFGVGVFFLISGMVIPFSIEKNTRLGFAAARILRIYPTYIAALLIEVAVLYTSSVAWHRPFTLTATTIWSNALLIYDLIGEPSLDLVNWTLSVELKFYLLAMLLLPAIRRGRAWVLLAAAAAIVAINAAMTLGWVGDIAAQPSTPSYTFSSHSVCLVFMLIGVAFNFHLRRLLSTPGLLAVVALLAMMFAIAWQLSVWHDQYPIVTANYAYALALFAALYAVRRIVPSNPALDAMAAVSFPFYVVHSLMGYTLLRSLMVGARIGYPLAIAITLPAILLFATALHIAIEKPSIRAGRALGKFCVRIHPQPAT